MEPLCAPVISNIVFGRCRSLDPSLDVSIPCGFPLREALAPWLLTAPSSLLHGLTLRSGWREVVQHLKCRRSSGTSREPGTEGCPRSGPAGDPIAHLVPTCWSFLSHPVRLNPWGRSLPAYPRVFQVSPSATFAGQLQKLKYPQPDSPSATFSPTSSHLLPCPVASGLAGALQHHGAFPCHSVFNRGSGS